VIKAQESLACGMTCATDVPSLHRYYLVPTRTWRDFNVFEHECHIECQLPRIKCDLCGKIKTVKAPWEVKIKGFTLLFKAFALILHREMPVNAVAKILGKYDTRLCRLLKGYVLEAYDAADLSDVRVIGCG
jgi:transposase